MGMRMGMRMGTYLLLVVDRGGCVNYEYRGDHALSSISGRTVSRKPKLLPDCQFAFPDGVWARHLHQRPPVNVRGPTAPRPVIIPGCIACLRLRGRQPTSRSSGRGTWASIAAAPESATRLKAAGAVLLFPSILAHCLDVMRLSLTILGGCDRGRQRSAVSRCRRAPLPLHRLLDRERTIAPPGFNRWLIPPAALAVHLCIGEIYGFSVFNGPLTRIVGITNSIEGQDWTIPEVVTQADVMASRAESSAPTAWALAMSSSACMDKSST
jgi:hypothetical protein